uniref:DUF7771 domain-containing protein n=1 Tax=Oryza brachyantha TaxID=4533 RepID=J3LWT6_ORYBR
MARDGANSLKAVKKVSLVAAIVAAAILSDTACGAGRTVWSPRRRSPSPPRSGRRGPAVELPPVCSFGWPCDPEPEEGNSTVVFSCDVENRMGDTIYLQCDGDFWAFAVGSGETVRHRLYDDRSKVSCAWAFDGNYKSGVAAWDPNWPEASSCRVDAAAAGRQDCRLLFENREAVLLTAPGGRPVLGGLQLCIDKPTPWYARAPWADSCAAYPNTTTRPYVGTVQPSWMAALLSMDH